MNKDEKLSFKHKVYLFVGILVLSSLIVDGFNLIELNRYNGLMAILLLTMLFSSVQYYAAKKGLDTLLSINRYYQIRKLWNKEKQFDWETVREKELKWTPALFGLSLAQLAILIFTGDTYTTALIAIWAIFLFSYTFHTRPLKKQQ
ncbi:hypothetical protein [Alkalibacterium sp.]|nr:MAG: hypothetical protein EA249_09710 [Alkalibacterium sp.]